VTGVRRHDRYVLAAFLTSLGAVLVFFTVIILLVHLADRGPRIVKYFPALREAGYDPLALALELYATLVPFVWLQLLPFAGVIAAAFGLNRLMRHNELAPLVTSGVSARRLTLPILLAGVAMVGALFAFQETLIPSLSRRHMFLHRLLSKSEPDRVTKVPHFTDPGGARLSVDAYQPIARRLEGALLTFRDPEGRPTELRAYPLLAWEPDRRTWTSVRGGTLFALGEDPTGRTRRPLPPGETVPLRADVLLLEVSALQDLSMGMSTAETAALLAVDPTNPRLVLLHHQQFTRCLAPVVLLLLGLPFCLSFGRRSAIPGTAAVLGSGAALYSLSLLCSRLATSGALNPVAMAWLPTVLLAAIGLALWLTVRS
jgi:lipopolysaccharide export LptBFGC system permease protein LptF